MDLRITSNNMQKMVFDSSKRYIETGMAYHDGPQGTVSFLIESACQLAFDDAVGRKQLKSTMRVAAMGNLALLLNNFHDKELDGDQISVIRQTLLETAAAAQEDRYILAMCNAVMDLLLK